MGIVFDCAVSFRYRLNFQLCLVSMSWGMLCGIAVRVRSTIALRGYGEDMTPATTELLAAASVLISASHCKSLAS